MFQGLYNFFSGSSIQAYILMAVSIFLSGLSIKLFDDYIDEDKRGYVPYILFILCISLYLWKESGTLFLSSYIVGMFHDENLKLISGLKSYAEQIIVLVVCILLYGILATISSLFIICAIQLTDDLVDRKEDRINCKKNWALNLGTVEAAILASVFVLVSVYIDAYKAIVCILFAFIITFIFKAISIRSVNK